MREGAAGVWITPVSSSPPSLPSSPSPESTGSVHEATAMRRSQPTNNFTKCPSEMLVTIAKYVDDLRTLASVSRLFEDIASHVDFERHQRFLPAISKISGVITFNDASFHLTLWSWKHAGKIRLNQRHKMSYIVPLSSDDDLAKAQVKALLGFLSTPFTACPFSSITVLNVGALSPTDILDLLLYCDDIGCWEVAIEADHIRERSGFYQAPSMPTRTSSSPLKNIRKLQLDHPNLNSDEWSYLFKHIGVPHLESLDIRGQPSFVRFGKFLSLHQWISTLCFYSTGGKPKFCRSKSKITLPLLNSIQGPAANVTATLRHLDALADIVVVDIEPTYGETFYEYTSGVLNSLKHIDTLIELKIHMNEEFARSSVKTPPCASVMGQIHNVLTLDISFCSSIQKSSIPVSASKRYEDRTLTYVLTELL